MKRGMFALSVGSFFVMVGILTTRAVLPDLSSSDFFAIVFPFCVAPMTVWMILT